MKTKAITIVLYTCICMCIHIECIYIYICLYDVHVQTSRMYKQTVYKLPVGMLSPDTINHTSRDWNPVAASTKELLFLHQQIMCKSFCCGGCTLRRLAAL